MRFGANLDTQRVKAETLALAILLVAANHLRGAYNGRRLLFSPIAFGEVAIIWTAIYGIFAVLIFPHRVDEGFARVSLPLLFGFGFASLAGVRLSFLTLGARLAASDYLLGPAVVVMTDLEGEALGKRLSAMRAAGCNIQLVKKIPAAEANASAIDAILENVMSFVRRSRIDEILIVMRWTRVLELQPSLEILSTVPHPIRLIPDEESAWFLSGPPTAARSEIALIFSGRHLGCRSKYISVRLTLSSQRSALLF